MRAQYAVHISMQAVPEKSNPSRLSVLACACSASEDGKKIADVPPGQKVRYDAKAGK